jgi:hypothetical protein
MSELMFCYTSNIAIGDRNTMARWTPKTLNFKPIFLTTHYMVMKIKLEDIRAPSRVLCCTYLPDATMSYPSSFCISHRIRLFLKMF